MGETVENQHRKIAGYRELNEAEITAMNTIKLLGVEIGKIVAELRSLRTGPDGTFDLPPDGIIADQRWVSIGETHLQQGLMALTRAVARPDLF